MYFQQIQQVFEMYWTFVYINPDMTKIHTNRNKYFQIFPNIVVLKNSTNSYVWMWVTRVLLSAGGQWARSRVQRQCCLHRRPRSTHGRYRVPGCLQVPDTTSPNHAKTNQLHCRWQSRAWQFYIQHGFKYKHRKYNVCTLVFVQTAFQNSKILNLFA